MGGLNVAQALAVCGLFFAAGCSTFPQGPVVGQPRFAQAAAEATVAKLTAGMNAVAVKVRVSRSGRVGAFSWPDGRVELTSGLVERLNEDEIAAAIAHELGHVLEGQPGGATSALSGRSGSPDDVEARADRFATRLLARAGYDPSAMSRTLTKVMNTPGMAPACRARLAGRIALLRTGPSGGRRASSPLGRGLG